MNNLLLDTAQEVALSAGKYLAQHFGGQQLTEVKESKHSIVTAHDIAAEKIIVEKLQALYPTHGILSEEMGYINRESEFLWVIDPLDGSSYYARGLDSFCVSVALLKHSACVLGVVYFPISQDMFVAEKGAGAYCSGQRIVVSETIDCKAAMASFGHRYIRLEKYQPTSLQLLQAVRSVRAGGSCAMELCLLASGKIDLLLTVNQSYWDYAAGALIVTEAGGHISDINGQPMNALKFLDAKFDLLATNGKLQLPVLSL